MYQDEEVKHRCREKHQNGEYVSDLVLWCEEGGWCFQCGEPQLSVFTDDGYYVADELLQHFERSHKDIADWIRYVVYERLHAESSLNV